MSFRDWLRQVFVGGTGHGKTLQGQQLADMVRRDYPDVHVNVLDPKKPEPINQEPEQDDPWLSLMEEDQKDGTTT